MRKYKEGDLVTVKLNWVADALNDEYYKTRKEIKQIYGMEVVKHEPAPAPAFDWATVKPGMAFKFTGRKDDGETVFYVFTDKDGHLLFTLNEYGYPQKLRLFGDTAFTRAPEHDIEVK